MFFGNPVFPITFQIEEVASLVEEILRKKNWHRFEKGEIKLVLTPFYLFYYDAVFEEEGKPTGKSERGRLALNAQTAELTKEMAEAMPEEEALVKELPDSYPLILRKALFSKQEAEKIALLKTASMIGTDRKNVILTNFQVIYFPLWLAFVTVAKETYQLEISAVTGEVFGEEKVPEREKGFVEVTKETLSELKKPGAWIKYSKEIADVMGETISGEENVSADEKSAGSLPKLLQKQSFWITIALLIILILLAFYL